jgi:hypothetical protein
MEVYLTLISGNDVILHLVGDFARGLGCKLESVAAPPKRGIRIQVPDVGHSLVEILTHVALSAAKAGVDTAEPLCQLTSRHPGVSSEVRLAFRINDFSIDTAAAKAL